MEKVYTIDETAEFIKCSPQMLFRLRKLRRIEEPMFNCGKRAYYSEAQIVRIKAIYFRKK